jgi:hypothetical protein
MKKIEVLKLDIQKAFLNGAIPKGLTLSDLHTLVMVYQELEKDNKSITFNNNVKSYLEKKGFKVLIHDYVNYLITV